MKSITDLLKSSLIIPGDTRFAYRDPAALYHDGLIYLFFTLVETEPDGEVRMYVAQSDSHDLVNWSKPRKLTVSDPSKNFSSPGNIIYTGGRYIMCMQTYCRENGEKYGNANCRVYFAESIDLENWSEPYPVLLKGDHVPLGECGRMIDPYLIYSEEEKLWFCFFKQNGISFSSSPDLVHWHFRGRIDGGENVTVVRDGGEYIMFHSPANGIGVKRSADLVNWRDFGDVLTFGQSDWSWAQGRLTAGNAISVPDGSDKLWLMFFHGCGPEDESVNFDINCSIGVAWSRDLVNWEWR